MQPEDRSHNDRHGEGEGRLDFKMGEIQTIGYSVLGESGWEEVQIHDGTVGLCCDELSGNIKWELTDLIKEARYVGKDGQTVGSEVHPDPEFDFHAEEQYVELSSVIGCLLRINSSLEHLRDLARRQRGAEACDE